MEKMLKLMLEQDPLSELVSEKYLPKPPEYADCSMEGGLYNRKKELSIFYQDGFPRYPTKPCTLSQMVITQLDIIQNSR
jgi:hypothetical protein